MSVAVLCANSQPSWSLAKKGLSPRRRFRCAEKSRLCEKGSNPKPRPSLRAKRSNPSRRVKKEWIASRSLSSGAHSRDPLARNDAKTHVRDLAARCARGVDETSAQRGRGERRMPVAPAASRALCIGRKHTSKRVPRNHPTFPHAMVLTVSFVLSSAIGLFCHRRLAD
jgi:hypothetical protein